MSSNVNERMREWNERRESDDKCKCQGALALDFRKDKRVHESG